MKAVTMVPGGKGALERAREAAFDIGPFLLEAIADPGGAVHISVNHDAECPSRDTHDIATCTCQLVEVVITALTPSDRALLETAGDYKHVEQGLAQRVRWPSDRRD